MKAVIRLPAIFLLIFIIVSVTLVFFNLLATAVAAYTDFNAVKPAALFAELPAALFQILPGSLILSLMAVLLIISLKPAPPFIAVLVLFAVAYAAFTLPLDALGRQVSAVAARPAEATDYFQAGKINNLGPLFVYPSRVSTNVLLDTLLIDPDSKGFKFTFYNRLGSTLTDNTVTLIIENKRISHEVKNPCARFLSGHDPFSGAIFRAFGILNGEFLVPKPHFYLSCFAFLFFIMAAGMFTRLTRWPLLNSLLFLSIITLYLFLYSFFKTEVYEEFLQLFKDKALLDYLPALSMLALGVLFVLIDVIFIPRKYRKEGIQVD